MAEIVSGFCMPHDPLITAQSRINEQEKAEHVWAAFDEIHGRLRAAEVDTVVVIGDDHYCLFGPHCLPRYLIGIGDIEGPEEPWLGFERYPVPNNEGLARHIMQHGFDTGFDWAVAKVLRLDHGVMVPVHLGVRPRESGMRVVPIYLAEGVLPVLQPRRAWELGRNIGEAIASYPGAERVAVFGTGGISHWVGTAEMGRVNPEFDQFVLDCVRAGDVESLIALSDEEIIERGGNGGLEIRNWICAMGAVQPTGAEIITYEPIPEWITGLGFAELKRAA